MRKIPQEEMRKSFPIICQFNIVSPTYLPFPHPQFQPTMEQNIKKKKKIPESSKKQNLTLPYTANYL